MCPRICRIQSSAEKIRERRCKRIVEGAAKFATLRKSGGGKGVVKSNDREIRVPQAEPCALAEVDPSMPYRHARDLVDEERRDNDSYTPITMVVEQSEGLRAPQFWLQPLHAH